MPLELPDSARELVAACFDAATIAQATAWVEGGRVHLVKPPPWPVVARVGGEVVTVHHDHGLTLRGECSCAPRGDCEHAAATALAALLHERQLTAQRAAAAQQAVVGEWLAELGRGEAPVTPETPPERAVAYVLDGEGAGVHLTVVHCPRLRQGGLGVGSPIAALSDPQRGPPPWVDVEDLRRIALLRAVTRVAPQTLRLPVDRIHGELMAELAASGRLFWKTTRGRPLTYGAPVSLRLGWRPVDDDPGCVRLGIDSALIVVPARDCHYVDPETMTLGPLDLGVPAALVPRLIAGPAVPAPMRATVERSLGVTLPSSPSYPSESLRPRLVARLGGERETRNLVQLVGEAVYGEQRFPLGIWDAARPAARDLVAEGRCQARLDALIAGLPHGAKARSSLECLADARHVADAIVPVLRAEGWQVILDESFPHDVPLEDVSFVERLRPLGESRDWFALDLGVTVAGRTIPLLPILLQAIRDGQLVLEAGGAVAHVDAGLNVRLPEGELVHIPAERVRRWLRPLIELELRGVTEGELRLPAPVAAQLEVADAPLGDVRQRLAALLALAPRHEEARFAGTLRDYQRIGLGWLRILHDAGYGGVLADEMGLGKTVQLLAFLDGLELGHALVVAPRSVVGNWREEALRFAPQLRPTLHLGGGRGQDAAALTASPLVLTSYQTLARDVELFAAIPWTTVIFDEAQTLKNPSTQLRGAAARLRARSRFCVTGTPLENHLGELWSQVDLVMPGLLGRRAAFQTWFRRPIEKYGLTPQLEHLRQRLRPFLLRRTKDTVELELPPKTEILETIELDTAQRDLYESLRARLDAEVRAALTKAGIQGASMTILDALLKLRQACCDPRLIKLPEARKVTGSAKLERLMEMLEELADSGRTTLVFSQFTSMLALIEAECERLGLSYLTLTGATRDRESVVRRFQAGEARVFLVSLKTGGVGLNLTRADTVIHYDPWWNPAVEAQATDRAHRIGQERHVMVYNLVARGTLEEAIATMQDEKRRLAVATLEGGGATRLAPADLEALYRRIV